MDKVSCKDIIVVCCSHAYYQSLIVRSLKSHGLCQAVRVLVQIKSFERILKKALLSCLSEIRTIAPQKHGFLPCRSYFPNLLVFEEAATLRLDKGHTVDAIFHNFTKAFGLGDIAGR